MSSLARDGRIRTKRRGKRSKVKTSLAYLLRRGVIAEREYNRAVSNLDRLLLALPQAPTEREIEDATKLI